MIYPNSAPIQTVSPPQTEDHSNFQHLVFEASLYLSRPISNYLLKVSNDGKIGVITKRDDLFMDHKSEDTEHSGTAIVELDGTLLKLGFFIKVIPAEVDVSITEVTDVFIAGSG